MRHSGKDRTGHRTGRKFLYFRRVGGGGEVTPRNKFPIPGQTLYGCKCATVERTGQDTGQDANSCISERWGRGGGGGVTPRNKFPIPEQTLYGCKCAKVETQHYTNVRQIPGGGGDGQPQTLNRIMNQFW